MPDTLEEGSPATVPETQLGPTAEELETLRAGQPAIAPPSESKPVATNMNTARDGSLLLDTSSLRALGRHFDTILQNIEKQITHLTQQSNTPFTDIDNPQGNLIDAADAEIAKCHDII